MSIKENPTKKIWIQLTLVISTSGISTLRICQRICKVPNSVPIHCIYNFAYTFVSRHFAYLYMFFRSQTVFSRLSLIVCLDNHCIHNANCENCTPCVFPGQIRHQLIFHGAVLSMGHSIYKAYVIGEHV